MGDATVNGDMPSSSFLSHLTSYPVVSDSIETFKSNPYGKKSIDITNASYSKFVKPTFPYLETPVSYAKPYIAKADQIGDSLLSKVDEKVPVVKKETSEIKGSVMDMASWPSNQAYAGKDYVLTKWSDEYKKCGGDGYVAGSKALITTQLVIASDVLNWLSSFMAAKKDQAQTIYDEKSGEAKKFYNEKSSDAKKMFDDKSGEAKKFANDKSGEAKTVANEKSSEVKEKASK